jgi:hypothetical protein
MSVFSLSSDTEIMAGDEWWLQSPVVAIGYSGPDAVRPPVGQRAGHRPSMTSWLTLMRTLGQTHILLEASLEVGFSSVHHDLSSTVLTGTLNKACSIRRMPVCFCFAVAIGMNRLGKGFALWLVRRSRNDTLSGKTSPYIDGPVQA